MSITGSTPVTGQFGALVVLRGATAPFLASPLVPKPAQARNSRQFTPGTLYGLSDRTKKIIDPSVAFNPGLLVLKNTGSVIPAQQWTHLGGGDILFNAPPTVSGGTAEVQTVTVTGTGGTLALFFGGSTVTLAYTATTTAAAVAAALQSNPAIGATGVTVAGVAGGPYTVTFAGPLGAGQQPVISTTGSNITGGATPGAAVAETTPGATPLTLDGSAISTGGNYDQFTLNETVDWKMAMASAMVTSNTYGVIADRKFPSFITPSFTFMQNSVDNLLFSYQSTNTLVTIAGFESTKSVPPRIWILQGYVSATPVDATGGGMVGGTKSLDCIQLPYFLSENI